MKGIFTLCLLSILSLWKMTAQVKQAPKDKAVIYFICPFKIGGALRTNIYVDNKIIGKLSGKNYIRHKCEPGDHIFWALAENVDYVTADVEAGKIYVIDVIPHTGMLVKWIRLQPVDPDKYKMKRMQKIIAKRIPLTFSEEKLAKWQNYNDKTIIPVGLKEFEERKVKSLHLEPSWSFDPLALTFKKSYKRSSYKLF